MRLLEADDSAEPSLRHRILDDSAAALRMVRAELDGIVALAVPVPMASSRRTLASASFRPCPCATNSTSSTAAAPSPNSAVARPG